jgi:tRNA(fMet)-specific endonuclease VapC
MKYLLDTNICIYIINQRPQLVLNRFQECSLGDIGISTITQYELFYGAYKSKYIDQNKIAIREFCLPLEVLLFDEYAADICGEIRAVLEAKGKVIGAMDIQIAAVAIAHDLILVTNNIKEFQNINNLKIENWAV